MGRQQPIYVSLNSNDSPHYYEAEARQTPIRSKYDAVQPKSLNERHFRMADQFSANASNDPHTLQILRNICRYERANGCYCSGAVTSVANELIGTGPRLQMRIPKNRPANSLIEYNFSSWMLATGMSQKLHTLVQATVGDGEGCAVLTTNPLVDYPVQLDLHGIEGDQLATPGFFWRETQPVNGIVFDEHKNPIEYHILREHPGELGLNWATGNLISNALLKYDKVRPKNFIHWFKVDRPGQARGIPWIVPGIGLFAQLRRWTLAALTAAETGASFAAVLKTEGLAQTEDEQDIARAWEEVRIRIGSMLTLPPGYSLDQFESKQPVAGFAVFKNELLKEIARCLCMPFPIIAGDSSASNYASGRLDFQSWYRSAKVYRKSFIMLVMEKLFKEWLNEAQYISGQLPSGLSITDIRRQHGWYFDGIPHVDPVKEATGDALNLANCKTTLADLCADDGNDWEEVLDQRSIEVAYMRAKGLDIYLPDYSMLVKKDIAEINNEPPPSSNGRAVLNQSFNSWN